MIAAGKSPHLGCGGDAASSAISSGQENEVYEVCLSTQQHTLLVKTYIPIAHHLLFPKLTDEQA